MGHFGRNPIRVSWLVLVLPALICNYMGQGALLFSEGVTAIESPSYMLARDSLQLPLVLLATAAAIIASQAAISGARSGAQTTELQSLLRISHDVICLKTQTR